MLQQFKPFLYKQLSRSRLAARLTRSVRWTRPATTPSAWTRASAASTPSALSLITSHSATALRDTQETLKLSARNVSFWWKPLDLVLRTLYSSLAYSISFFLFRRIILSSLLTACPQGETLTLCLNIFPWPFGRSFSLFWDCTQFYKACRHVRFEPVIGASAIKHAKYEPLNL